MNLLNKALRILCCIILPLTGEARPSNTQLNNQASLPSQANITNNYSFQQLGWTNAITLNGYNPDALLYLPLPKQATIQKMVLHLKMAFSPALTEETKVDIMFNQVRIGSLSPPTDLAKETSIDIELPITQLSDAWQVLSFSAYLSSNKNLCNPNVWIYISPQSGITVDSKALDFRGSLNELPYPFIQASAIKSPPVQLLLPKMAQTQEIFSLLQVAFKLGEQADSENVSISSSILEDSAKNIANSNLILIGNLAHIAENTSEEFKNMTQQTTIKSERSTKNGILLLSQSPFNAYRALLVISGANDEALNKATQAFLTREFNASASGKLAIINDIETKPSDKDIGQFYETTLKELGYSNTSVSGLGRHHVSFNIPLPNDQIPDGMKISTLITAPILSERELSRITLLINEQKQASSWIKSEHSIWTSEISPSSLKPGLNKLDYFIDLHFENNDKELCTRANYDEAWATIYAQTKVNTSFSNEFPLAMLNQLPVPFAGEVTAILPEKLSNNDIDLFSRFFFKLGQPFQSSSIQINFKSSGQVTEEFIRNHNIIILGVDSTNPWVQYTFNYMPVQLKNNSRFVKLPERQLQISSENSTGLIELMPSPWSEHHAVLLLTSNNEQGLQNAINTLMENKSRNQLNGNIAFINSDNTFEIINSFDSRYVSTLHRGMAYLSNAGKTIYYYSITHPQIFVYLLVFLVPLMIALHNRRK